jgi:hypothetical protein
LAFAATIVVGVGGTARADTCFQQLRDCYQRAAGDSTFWGRTLAGLECEIDLLNCTRIEIVGR